MYECGRRRVNGRPLQISSDFVHILHISNQEQRFYECSKLKKQFEQLLQANNLIPKVDRSEQLKRINKAERQHLVELRSNAMRTQTKSGRKLLQMTEDQGEDEGKVDLHDLDFQLTINANGGFTCGKKLSEGDTILLSLVVASGLYPNLAISDAANHARRQSDYVFHTRSKPIVVLHPTTVYYSNVEFLNITSLPVDDLLCYGSLIETKKPYLCNVMKIPALQSLLLLAKSVDVNVDCSRMIIDDWLLVSMPSSSVRINVLRDALRLRKGWAKLVSGRLSSLCLSTDNVPEHINNNDDSETNSSATMSVEDIKRKLIEIHAPSALIDSIDPNLGLDLSTAEAVSESLIQFMKTKVKYQLERAKQSELHTMFEWDEPAGTKVEGDNESVGEKKRKGGVALSEHIRVGSLKSVICDPDYV
eukprot:CFRG3109T1